MKDTIREEGQTSIKFELFLNDNSLLQIVDTEKLPIARVRYIDRSGVKRVIKEDVIGEMTLLASLIQETNGITTFYGRNGSIIECNDKAIAYHMVYSNNDPNGEMPLLLLRVYDLGTHTFVENDFRDERYKELFGKEKPTVRQKTITI